METSIENSNLSSDKCLMGEGYIYLLTTYFQTQPYEEIYSRVQHDEDVQIPTYRPEWVMVTFIY